MATEMSFFLFSGVTEELDLPAEPLHAIFQSLIEALLKTSGSYQRVRANLYGSLLYYLQIGQRKDEQRDSHGKACVQMFVASCEPICKNLVHVVRPTCLINEQNIVCFEFVTTN